MMGMMEVLLILLHQALSTYALDISRQYHYINLSKNWTEAQSYCREKFADLATIESADDWATVREIVGNSGSLKAWTGLFDDVNSWKWSLSNSSLYKGENTTLESWFDFTADNSNSNQHCGFINKDILGDDKCDTERLMVCYDEPSNTYIPVTTRRNWLDAQSYCRQTYTDLASVRSQQEMDTIRVTIGTGWWWIGLSRDTWKWSDQTKSEFVVWAPTEPNSGSHNCGAATVDGMIDADCGLTLPFICSAPFRKVLKVVLKKSGPLDLQDPMVQEAIVKEMEKQLRRTQGEVNVKWRKQPDGKVLQKEEI